ncbi:MAG: hypothetical protein JWQ15_2614 [Marmoricola sp.]|nr:hypothetical protein [Marmoricola sp.]
MAYGSWSARATRSDLIAARDSGERLQRAIATQDSAQAQTALRSLQEQLSDAHDRTDGLLWGAGTHLPWIGDDVRAVREVSAVGDDLSGGTLAELVAESGAGLRKRLLPRNGRIDIAAVESIAPVVSRAHLNLEDALNRLRGADSDSLTHWVRPSYDALLSTVSDTNLALSAADRAARVLPTMLGKGGPRTYLVLFENNAEIRATGGLPGAFAVIKAERGRLSLTRQGAPAADVPKFAVPVLPQSGAERAIYDTQIAEYFQDTNFTPEFPRTAELVREMWQRTHKQKLDGVLSLDTVTLSYLLRATGPIEAPGGVRLTSSNAVSELLNNVYFRLPDDAQQNEFFRQVAARVFAKVIGGVQSTTELVTAMGQGAREGRVYVHDFDAKVQRALAGSTVAGELTSDDMRMPQVGVYLNDATGSKMSYYLRTRMRLKAKSCAAGEQQLEAVADLSYTKKSPPVAELNEFITGPGEFGTPKGEQLVLIRIYGPANGDLTSFRVAGEPTPVDTINDRGRSVATTVVQLRRGETVRVSWRVRTGPHQDRPARLSVSPGMRSQKAITRVASLCGTG